VQQLCCDIIRERLDNLRAVQVVLLVVLHLGPSARKRSQERRTTTERIAPDLEVVVGGKEDHAVDHEKMVLSPAILPSLQALLQ